MEGSNHNIKDSHNFGNNHNSKHNFNKDDSNHNTKLNQNFSDNHNHNLGNNHNFCSTHSFCNSHNANHHIKDSHNFTNDKQNFNDFPTFSPSQCCPSSSSSSIPQQMSPPSSFAASLLLDQASRAYALGDLDSALAHYRLLLQMEPANDVLWANMSAILLRMERGQAALEAADQAVRLAPGWAKAHFRQGEALFQLGKVDQAVLAHAEATRLSGGEDAQFRQALISSVKASKAAAVPFSALLEQLQQANLEENSFALLAAIGESFLVSRQPRMASQLLRQAVQAFVPSEHSNAMLLAVLGQLASAECQQANWVDAVGALERQLEVAQELADAETMQNVHGLLAELFASKLGNLPKAIRHKKEQIRLAEEAAKATANGQPSSNATEGLATDGLSLHLANLHLANGDLAECQRLFKAILQRQPGNSPALLGLGRCLFALRDFPAAGRLFSRVEKLGGAHWAEAHLLRAKCQLAKGELEKAEAAIGRLLGGEKGNNNNKSEGKATEKAKKHAAKELPPLLRAELCSLAAQLEMAKRRWEPALHWAKRRLSMGLRLASGPMLAAALLQLLHVYAWMGQWPNASRVADKLWQLLQPPAEDGTDFVGVGGKHFEAEALEAIGCLWRTVGPASNRAKAKKALERRLAMFDDSSSGEDSGGGEEQQQQQQSLEQKVNWARLAVDLAEMDLEIGEGGNAERANIVVNQIQTLLENFGGRSPADLHFLEVSILQLKAEVSWQNGDTEVARAGMERALMRAQEEAPANEGQRSQKGQSQGEEDQCQNHGQCQSGGQSEGRICTRLGEWAEAAGEDEEASVYLRQAIVLGKRMGEEEQQRTMLMLITGNGVGWRGKLANGQMLLSAFASLARVLVRQSHWEDALLALRSQLRLQRELDQPSSQRLRTTLALAKVLVELGALEAAERLLGRVEKRMKAEAWTEAEDEAKEEAGKLAQLLGECQCRLAAACQQLRESDYVNLNELTEPEEEDNEKEEEEGDGDGDQQKEKHEDGEDKGRRLKKEEKEMNKKRKKSYHKVKKEEQQRRRSSFYEQQESEGFSDAETTAWWRGKEGGGRESDAESTASGAFVLGVDLGEEEEDE